MGKIDYHSAALQAKKYGYDPNKFHESRRLDNIDIDKFTSDSLNEIPLEDIPKIESSPGAKQCGRSLRDALMSKNGQRKLSQL